GLQEVRGALALLPERRAPTRPTAGEQERSRGGLAKDRGEERGRRELPKYQRLDLVGVEREVLERHALLGLGEADHDAIVAPQHLGVGTHPLRQARLDGHGPWGVDLRPERREQAHAPVAELVPEALD